MNIAPYLFVGIVMLVIALAAWYLARPRKVPALPYAKRTSLLTAAELRFFRVLQQALPSGIAVMVKVRLMDVVSVPDDSWQQYGAPGSGMHLDFVLADPETLAVLMVIELDDKSHWRSDVRERDAVKEAALAAARVTLLRVGVVARYDLGGLRKRIAESLGDHR
jgi:hypothetical protein